MGWGEVEAQLTGIEAVALLSFCNGGADKKHPKYCLPMRSFACPKKQTPPNTPEDQLGVTELQTAVKHCPDDLTMQPGFMAWSRTEKQLSWDRESGVSFTLLCHETLPAVKSHGPHSNSVAKAELSAPLGSPSSHCSQSTASHPTVDPEHKKDILNGLEFYFISGEKRKRPYSVWLEE